MIDHLPKDILGHVASFLAVWERISLSNACRTFRHAARNLRYGDFDQVKNKHYTQLQLVDQYTEWTTLRRMKERGCAVIFAPQRFTHFVDAEASARRKVQRS